MGEAAIDISRTEQPMLTQLRLVASASYERFGSNIPSRQVLLLGLILVALQLMDGILTGYGMYYFGTSAEGNILLQALMDQIGYAPALIIVKVLAIGIIGVLCYLSTMVSWIENAFKVVIFVYMGAAIIPWSIILLTHTA